MQKDYYQILGVTRTADQAEIKAAFRIQLKKNHPDLNQDDKAAAEIRTRDIIDAYRTLGNTTRRKLYDEKFRIAVEPRQDSPNQRSDQPSKPNYFKAAARAFAVMFFFFSFLGAATFYIVSNNSSHRDRELVAQREKNSQSGTGQSQITSSTKLQQSANGSKVAFSSSRQPGLTPTPSATLAPEAVNPIAQRAAILIEAPDDSQKVKTFIGTSLWHLDTSGEQPVLVAEIALPDAKLTVSMRMSRNIDAKLPASHTMEFRFTPAAGSEVPGIAEIDTPQMRVEDSANGAPLLGVPAPIMPNYFLVGLSNGDKLVSRNMELMRDRGWVDIPMVLSNGRIAKLTFEKGASGDRVLAQAMQAWDKP